MRNAIHGFPEFGADDPDVIISETLTSATDVPNDTGADIGSLVEFDSEKGARSTATDNTDQPNSQIYYDGPYSSNPATAWTRYDADIRAQMGVTFQFEVHKDVIEDINNFDQGTAGVAPIQIRGATGAGTGLLQFRKGGVSGNTTYEATIRTDYTGVTNVSSFHSKWANDKEFIPITLSFRHHKIDVFLDGMLANQWAVDNSAFLADGFDDLYIVGRQFGSGSSIAGFPYWMRNFQVVRRPIVLPLSQWDRPVFMGDSVVQQGAYYTGSPRFDAAQPGSNADAGMVPMLERLMHRRGLFTSRIDDAGRTGTRIDSTFTAGLRLIDEVTGSGGAFDALKYNPRVAVIFCGLNDAASSTTATANLKTDYRAVIEELLDNGVQHIVACTIYDANGNTTASNSASVITTRTNEINTFITDLANNYSRVHLADVWTAFGGATQNASLFRSDLLHPVEQGQATIGRTVFATLEREVF